MDKIALVTFLIIVVVGLFLLSWGIITLNYYIATSSLGMLPAVIISFAGVIVVAMMARAIWPDIKEKEENNA